MTPRVRAYGLAVLATGVAWLADALLAEHFNETSGGLYVLAALVSAWFGGLGPGLLAIALTAAINLAFFNHPELSLAVGVHGFDRLVFVVVMALVVSWIRQNQRLLKRLNMELEEKVKMRTAALGESNQQLEAFCYTLAHDLRAPLRSIQGFADLLITDHGAELDRDGKAGLERIRNSAERMGRLILDLLAYTDLTRADFRKQPVDVRRVCQAVRRMFADEIEQQRADLSEALPVTCVLGDPAGVERVLVNLVGNALKFTHLERAPRIHISSERRFPNVRICVEDNGIGLDQKYRERIFGVFERLTPTGNSVGTGIGLAMVKRSVEKMGGKVGVESTPGEGSCFWFELAEAEPETGKPAPEVQALQEPAEVASHK
jgi:signal transduction histidine kinase